MFCLGIYLIILSAHSAEIDGQTAVTGVLGMADLVGLYFFRPIEQIRKIMADMSQITVAINSHQTQVSLRLLETDAKDRATMGEAAELIQKAARDSLKNIQLYFEDSDITKKSQNSTKSANDQ